MDMIIGFDEPILVTGAAGFIGTRVVENLLRRGFRNLRCLIRPSRSNRNLREAIRPFEQSARVEIISGNLLSNEDCQTITRNAVVAYHLAAGTGTSSFPDAFMNSVVTTRNLLDATLQHKCLKRFVNVSSFAVYSNRNKSRRAILNELCSIEEHPELRGDAYCYAKVRQDELVLDYEKRKGVPSVILRPGVVYGPGKNAMIGRIGIGTFGIFLHLGGSNTLPLSYVENCAEAIVLAGLRPGIDGEIFNVVDDSLPSSGELLRMYKREVKSFKSIYIPKLVSYLLFSAWERYSQWSQEQLPPIFNRRVWHAYWKGSNYTNEKLKRVLGWSQRISTSEGLDRYFENCRRAEGHA
jgi:nucleoside-diphosphate-sugar epimerase